MVLPCYKSCLNFNSIICTNNRNNFCANSISALAYMALLSLKKFERVLICQCNKKCSLPRTKSASIGTISLKLMMIYNIKLDNTSIWCWGRINKPRNSRNFYLKSFCDIFCMVCIECKNLESHNHAPGVIPSWTVRHGLRICLNCQIFSCSRFVVIIRFEVLLFSTQIFHWFAWSRVSSISGELFKYKVNNEANEVILSWWIFRLWNCNFASSKQSGFSIPISLRVFTVLEVHWLIY